MSASKENRRMRSMKIEWWTRGKLAWVGSSHKDETWECNQRTSDILLFVLRLREHNVVGADLVFLLLFPFFRTSHQDKRKRTTKLAIKDACWTLFSKREKTNEIKRKRNRRNLSSGFSSEFSDSFPQRKAKIRKFLMSKHCSGKYR